MDKQKTKKNENARQKLRVFFGKGIGVKLSCICFVLFVACAIAAPILAPCDPYEQDLDHMLSGVSLEHPLGTDALGRDVLSRLIYGARITFVTSFLATVIACVIGSAMGMAAGYFGGMVGTVIMRLNDALLSIPSLIMAITLSVIIGNGIGPVALIIGIVCVPTYCRMVYAQVSSVRENEYILASRLIGLKEWKVMLKHILPNTIPTILVVFTMNLGSSIGVESGMSYLGIGIAPPTPSWGRMVSEGYAYLRSNPLIALVPGICIILIVIAYNTIGDALRDALDPRLRGKL